MIIIPKLYTREFPLILCEIWGKAYTHLCSLDKPTITFPRYIFIIKNGLVDAYRNEQMVKEFNQQFFEKLQADPSFLEKFAEDHLRKFEQLETLWHKPFLEREALLDFADKLVDFWSAIYASMYLPPDARFAADSERMIGLRKKTDVAADEATHIILASINHIFPGLGSLANYVCLQDVRNGKVDKEMLKELAETKLIMVDDRLVSEQELENLKKKHGFALEEIQISKDVREFKGQTACKGYAKGKVMQVVKRADVARFVPGSILVSTMTVPDYLPAMKKAAAFVTDEGGITCHAAIVAREMKKPCVIGTKTATKVLKDGDMVEVDADKGIVRKL